MKQTYDCSPLLLLQKEEKLFTPFISSLLNNKINIIKKRGSIHMKCSATGNKKGDLWLLIQATAWAGLTMSLAYDRFVTLSRHWTFKYRFDCTLPHKDISNTFLHMKIKLATIVVISIAIGYKGTKHTCK
jgi:hypothetical protein